MSSGKRLLCGTECRRVGGGSGKQTRHSRKRHVKHPTTCQGHNGTQNHQQGSVGIQHAPLSPQRGEEARPHLHSERKHEKNEPKLLQKVRHFRFRTQSKVRYSQTDEQHASST